tara:strand:+ start:413 stop:1120 length:708 start_codon:yes stop_codon:yes gene_type:complete
MITLSERKRNYVNVVLPLREGVGSYEVFIANTLENAYNPATLVSILTVRHNKVFLSPSIKKSRNPHYELGVNSKVTRIVFDPMDYYDPTTNTATDEQQMYLRVREIDKSGVALALSEILIIPPPNFFMYPSGAITLAHSAMTNHGSKTVGDLPDPRDLSFVVPNYLNFFRLHVPLTANHDVLYSPNKGMPYVLVPIGTVFNLFSIANNQFFLASAGAGTTAMSLFLTCSLDPIDG